MTARSYNASITYEDTEAASYSGTNGINENMMRTTHGSKFDPTNNFLEKLI
jgi:hypothetical protein